MTTFGREFRHVFRIALFVRCDVDFEEWRFLSVPRIIYANRRNIYDEISPNCRQIPPVLKAESNFPNVCHNLSTKKEKIYRIKIIQNQLNSERVFNWWQSKYCFVFSKSLIQSSISFIAFGNFFLLNLSGKIFASNIGIFTEFSDCPNNCRFYPLIWKSTLTLPPTCDHI